MFPRIFARSLALSTTGFVFFRGLSMSFSFLAYNLLLLFGLKIHREFSFNVIDPEEQ